MSECHHILTFFIYSHIRFHLYFCSRTVRIKFLNITVYNTFRDTVTDLSG